MNAGIHDSLDLITPISLNLKDLLGSLLMTKQSIGAA